MARTNREISFEKMREFIKENRDTFSIIKELLNTAGRYEDQSREAFSLVSNRVEEFQSLYSEFVNDEVPEKLSAPREVNEDNE